MTYTESGGIDFQLVETWIREAGRIALEGRDSLISGREFDLPQILDGSPSAEPLIGAPSSVVEVIRILIRYKDKA